MPYRLKSQLENINFLKFFFIPPLQYDTLQPLFYFFIFLFFLTFRLSGEHLRHLIQRNISIIFWIPQKGFPTALRNMVFFSAHWRSIIRKTERLFLDLWRIFRTQNLTCSNYTGTTQFQIMTVPAFTGFSVRFPAFLWIHYWKNVCFLIIVFMENCWLWISWYLQMPLCRPR